MSIGILRNAAIFAGILLLMLILPKNYESLYLTLPLLGIAISFCSTNTAILVSDSSDENGQGKTMGAAQSLRVLNIAIITILGGVMSTFSILLPMVVAGLVLLLTAGFVSLHRGISYGNVMD